MSEPDRERLEAVVSAIKQSRKYGSTHRATIEALARQAVHTHAKDKGAIKAVRKRLHSIMAPYLGDPDYAQAHELLSQAFATGNDASIRTACTTLMAAHLSTRERLPILEEFFPRIFTVTGQPRQILDIASGLNPLAWRWMGLPRNMSYYSYDIHEPRVALLGHYFELEGMEPLARLQDIALRPPQEEADVALFLKELPRFERNYPGQSRRLLEQLKVRFLVVSFPTVSTHGGRSLVRRYREFLAQLLADQTWRRQELMFEGEMVYVIDKEQSRSE